DRWLQMKLLLLRDPGFRKERLIELHKSLELECGGGLHHKRDYRRESKNPITARRSTGGIEFSLESGGVTKNTLGMNDVSDPALEVRQNRHRFRLLWCGRRYNKPTAGPPVPSSPGA